MVFSRRSFLQLSAASFAPVLAAADRPSNILFILADDLGAGELGCYGNRVNVTPNLDILATQGVRFETCYATPLCSPSRVQVMTGKYGFRTGFTNLIGRVTTRKDRLSADEVTFADVLKRKGYATGLSGKWQLGLIQKHPNMIHDSGFDEYFSWAWNTGGLPADAKFEGSERQRYWHPAIVANGKHVPTTPDQHGEDLYSDWIVSFMRKHKGRPFLAYYPMCLTHEPWDPTPDLKSPGKRTEGGFKNNVEYMDHIVGKVLKSLDDLGLAENTIVFFAGDNGSGKNGKGKVTEKGVRVPMIVRGPGIGKGIVSRELVDFSDVLPTMAEFAGATPPRDIDGRSFASVLQGKPGPRREWIFSYLAYGRMLRDKRWLLEGDGKFYDCGDSRNGAGYKEVGDDKGSDVLAARKRFDDILRNLPAPPPEKA